MSIEALMPMTNSLITSAPKVSIATTEAEKEEIYRLRYEVYIEEMEGARRHPEADTDHRRFRDELDDYAVQFYIKQDGVIVGCARVNLRRDGPWECEDRFDLERFHPAYPNQVAMASRFALRREARGTILMLQLSGAIAEFLCDQDQRFCFLDCHPELLPLYSRLGFRIYKPGFKHPNYTYVVPMVFVYGDLEHLEQVRSPLLPIARRYPGTAQWRDLLLQNFPVAADTFVSAEADKERRSAAAVAPAPKSEADELKEDYLRSLLTPEALAQIIINTMQAVATQGAEIVAQEQVTPTLSETNQVHPCVEEHTKSIFARFSEDEIRRVLSLGQMVSCSAGDPIVCTGEQGREIFLIVEGSFQEFGNASSVEAEDIIVVNIFVPGEILGEMGYFTHGRRCSTVLAMEDSSLLVLNGKTLDRILKSAPELACKLFRNLARMVETKYYDSLQT
jgi:CRP-like cAMP-binding protein